MKSLTNKQLEVAREKILETLYPLPIQKTQAEHAANSIVRFLKRLEQPKPKIEVKKKKAKSKKKGKK